MLLNMRFLFVLVFLLCVFLFEKLFKVLKNVSILLDFVVFLPIVYHLWLLRLIGIIAFGIHGVHGLWDSVTAGGNEGSFSFVETL